jgi:hypothetical protein
MDIIRSKDLSQDDDPITHVSPFSLNYFARTPVRNDPYSISERSRGWSKHSVALEAEFEKLDQIICGKASKIKEGREEISKEERA